jgi:hypothetical protein
MTNEQIRLEILDMIPFRYLERFEVLWGQLIPKHERLTEEQLQKMQEFHNEKEMFWSSLEDIVCTVVGVPSQVLYTKTRKRDIVMARQIVFFLIRPCYFTSLAEIGSRYSKDHATVLHGIKQVTWQIEVDPSFRATLERICYLLNEVGFAKPSKFYAKFVEHIEHEKEIKRKKQLKQKSK